MELSAPTATAPAVGANGIPIRYVLAVSAGNALGFYDFLVFSFFSVQIGRTIFPPGEGSSALLLTLATFGAGFLTRPIGALVLGRLGDRIGRKPAMMLSLTLTGAAVLGQAMVPSYAAIGIAAPLLMLALRLAVGFGLGGEVGPSTAFLVEAAPVNRRGFYVSLQYATQDLSILVAGIVGYVLAQSMSASDLDQWGWRIALALGAAAVPLALYLRRRLPETLEIEELHPSPAVAHHQEKGRGMRLAVLAFLILAMGSVAAYSTNYMTTYAQNTLQMATDIAFGATIALGVAAIICDLASGWLSDVFGRKPTMIATGVLFLVLILPSFTFLEATRSQDSLILVSLALGGLVALATTPALVAITESLPKSSRSTSLAIIYALGISIFGGTTQFAVTWLIGATGDPLAPAYYLTASQAIWVMCAFLMRESAPRVRNKA